MFLAWMQIRLSISLENALYIIKFYFIGGTAKSLQILLAMMLLISECLGIEDLLFNFGLCHQE